MSRAVSRDELIRVLSLAAGVGAYALVNVESVVDSAIAAYSRLSTPRPSASDRASNPVSSAINHAGAFVDEQLIRAQIRADIDEFDHKSPVPHTFLLRIALATLAIAGSRLALRALV